MAEEEEILEVEAKKQKKERVVRRITVRENDTNKELTDQIIEIAQQALDDSESLIHKEAAQRVKQRLDKEKGGTWHVIVGSHFGGNVTNDANTLINFQVDGAWFLVFRSGPPEKNGDREEHK